MKARPKPGTVICRLDELPDPGARGFWYTTPLDRFFGFVVRKGEHAYGYVDICPHAGWRLSPFDENGYLTPDKQHVFCSGHIAVFRLEDGFCEAGPCEGQSLTPWPVEVVDGAVVAA